MAADPLRTIVYIDGFNFYYGAVRNTAHKWLNFDRLFSMMRPRDDIRLIKYFTAEIVGPTKPNQDVYLQALATLPRMRMIMGRFEKRPIRCEVRACVGTHGRTFDKPEEKGSDVNIAIEMLDDAYQDQCDQLILVTGDSDQVAGLRRIRSRFPEKRIVVYIPALQNTGRSGAHELRSAAHVARTLPLNLLPRAQFHPSIPDGHGGTLHKPSAW